MIEAKCNDCNETFIPDGEGDLIHGVREDGEMCGGQGVIVGEWKLSTQRIIDTSPQTFVLATLSTGRFQFEALGRTKDEARRTMELAWATHCVDYEGARDWPYWDDAVNYSDIKIGEALRDGETIYQGPSS